MTFDEILAQMLDLLQRQGRVSYRALKRRFALDDDYLEDLKAEIIKAQRLAVDEGGEVLVWTGSADGSLTPAVEPVRAPHAYTPPHLAEKILTSRSALEGERKQVTVMFADLKASMELLADRDPEEARQLLDPVLERMMASVHRYEGTVNQIMGDGIMALFGAPIAHEDHAVRACYAALAMQEAIRRYSKEVRREYGLEVQIRVGLNSGEVVVRAIGNDLHMDYSAIGQTTHLAARMEQLAPPGSIRLTAETLRLAEGLIQVTPLGPVPVKGLSAPVEVWGLVGAGPARTRLQAFAARGLTPFVGRQAELKTLHHAMAQAEAGHGQVVAVIGESGVGKTRLFHEFTHTSRTHGWLRLESSSASYGKATPYLPVLDLLKTYLQIEERDDGRRLREKLTGRPCRPSWRSWRCQWRIHPGRRSSPRNAASAPSMPSNMCCFKHALTLQVAYETLLQERRRALHTSIVEGLEALAGDRVAEQVERLAHHALRGEVWDKALAYCRQAGEKAMMRSAYRESVESFEQALSALQHLPDTHEAREQAIDLRLALRSALWPSGGSGRILEHLREAEALAVALDDPRRLGHISDFLSVHFRIRGVYDQAIASAQRALTLATADGDVVLQVLANQRLGAAYQAQGDYRRAIDCLGQTVVALAGARRRERFGQVFLPTVQSHAWLAWCHAELGTFAQGRALGDEGLRIAEAVAHPASLLMAAWGLGLLAFRQGDLARALPQLERALGICQDADLPLWFPWMAPALGAAYTLGGRIADAVPLLTQAIEQTTVMEMIAMQALCHLSLGEAQLQAGRLEDAQALAERALALARERRERGHQAYAMRLMGDTAARRQPRETAPAEAHYQQALALAEGLGMRPLVAHCHLGLGKLYAKIGRRAEAYAELSTAVELYWSMEMTFWLPQAEAALARVEGEVG